MGSIKKIRKKYVTPPHPWQEIRIKQESGLVKNYGLKNKREIWKAAYHLRSYTWQAKQLVGDVSTQAVKERELLLKKLQRYNFIGEGQDVGDVLSLSVQDILDRRLQTIVVTRKLAKTMSQARQLITHGHISVNGKKIDSPGHLVTSEEENNIGYITGSSFEKTDHPERAVMFKSEQEEKVKEEKVEEKVEKGRSERTLDSKDGKISKGKK